MNRKIKLTKTAQLRLDQLLEYLEKEWSEKVKQDFIKKMDKRIEHVSIRPSLFPTSSIKKGLHKCVVSKQRTFYSCITRLKSQYLQFFDTRQDPNYHDTLNQTRHNKLLGIITPSSFLFLHPNL